MHSYLVYQTLNIIHSVVIIHQFCFSYLVEISQKSPWFFDDAVALNWVLRPHSNPSWNIHKILATTYPNKIMNLNCRTINTLY